MTTTISIEEIAQWCHFSQSHFMKFFKNCTGTSFITYLNDYRLIIAARILKTTTQPVIIVASDCGFDNISYFNRKFKEKYGVSPREFRKIL
jgi:AraC-like DNA-binding protein